MEPTSEPGPVAGRPAGAGGVVLTEDAAEIWQSRSGSLRALVLVLAGSAGAWWVAQNHSHNLFLVVLIVLGVGTIYKIALWDSVVGLIRPRPRVVIDRNGISYAGAFAYGVAVWEEITSLEYSEFGMGLILVGVDMGLWRASRPWWRRWGGSLVAWSMKSQVGVETPFYIQCYRIATSPEDFTALARRFAPPHVVFRMPEIVRTTARR
jgi:hypothetical protein